MYASTIVKSVLTTSISNFALKNARVSASFAFRSLVQSVWKSQLTDERNATSPPPFFLRGRDCGPRCFRIVAPSILWVWSFLPIRPFDDGDLNPRELILELVHNSKCT